MPEATPVYVGCKTCTKCKQVKSLSEFTPRHNRVSGYASQCKACVNAGCRERHRKPPVRVGPKTCGKCAETKPVEEFSRKGSGYNSRCKPCIADDSRERYQGSPEARAKHKVLRDRWRAENPTYSAEYYQQNREKLIAAAIEYQKRNPVKRRRNYDPELRRQQERTRYAANRERYAATKRAWRESNPEVVAEARRRSQSVRRARKRALPAVAVHAGADHRA